MVCQPWPSKSNYLLVFAIDLPTQLLCQVRYETVRRNTSDRQRDGSRVLRDRRRLERKAEVETGRSAGTWNVVPMPSFAYHF